MELPKNEGFFEFWVTLLTEWLSVWSHQHQSKQFLLGSSPLDHMLDQLMLLCTFSLALERSGLLGKLLYHVSKCGFKLQSRHWLSLPEAPI